MENYAQLVSLLSALLALPRWDPESVSHVLGAKLLAIKARTPKLRCYVAEHVGSVVKAELDHPVYGGSLGWAIHITPVMGPPADPLVALAPILSKLAERRLSGPPTPGSGGPTIFRQTLAMRSAQGEAVFSLEGPAIQGPLVCTGVTLRRPHPNFPPEVRALDRFRAFSVQQAEGAPFVIEHRDGERSAVRVLQLRQEGRSLRVTFVPDDPFIDEQFAHDLIRRKLLDEHLEHRFRGAIDRIVFSNAELGTEAVGEP